MGWPFCKLVETAGGGGGGSRPPLPADTFSPGAQEERVLTLETLVGLEGWLYMPGWRDGEGR